MPLMSRTLLVVGALTAASTPGCSPTVGAERLVFGIPSTESSVQLAAAWRPFLVDMEAALGVQVEPFFATDYAGVIEAMRGGHVNLAWFGNKAAIEAVDRAGGEVFVQMVDGDGHAGYWSVLVARRSGRIDNLEQLFATPEVYAIGLGDPNSTSGFVVPMAQLFGPRGIDPRRAFGRALQGNHESNAMAVALGHVDIAPVDSKVLRRFANSHPEQSSELVEIWRSEMIPSDMICWHEALSTERRERLRAWFLQYGKNESERRVLAGLDLVGFQPATSADLNPMRLVELRSRRLRVLADSELSASERSRRVAELDHRIGDLERKGLGDED